MQKEIDIVNQSLGAIDLAKGALLSVVTKLLQENQALKQELESLKNADSN